MGACALHAHADDTDSPATNSSAALSSDDNGNENNQKRRARFKKSDEEIKQITITGARQDEMEERRLSTASKMVFGREELDREGDSTIGEILKRLPGVTISGTPGRGGDIRMRGLGHGYTQILVNGERPPRGFSMDSLTPDQVERIEIYRAPVAEFSTQAIAGTINIVLREDFKMKYSQANLSEGFEQGRSAPNVSITHPGEIGNLSYLLSGSVFENHQRTETLTETTGADDNDNPELQYVESDSLRTTRGIHLTPRFNYRFGSNDTLTVQPFLMHSEGESYGTGLLTQILGTAPYAATTASSTSDSNVTRVFTNWQHKFADNSKVNIKLSFGAGRSSSETLTKRDNVTGKPDNLVSSNSNNDSGSGTSGKYSTPAANGHALAFGWDGEWRKSTQTRVSLDNGVAQFDDSGSNLSAQTRRLAVFAQDEWDINKEWSTYLGLRWEGIKTFSTLPSGSVENSTSVWSPLWHSVWRIPGHEKDQLRMSLTHSYRAPALSDLIALPAIAPINTRFTPNRIGNPELKPELAKGIDFAYEHYLPAGGIFSASVFMRNISNLMRRETTQQSNDGPWVSRPINIGDARTSGLELEAKFRVTDFIPDGPSMDVRANYSRFWSSVDGIPGPNNRLDQQPKQTANVGLDYHAKSVPLTLGGNLNWTPGYLVQTSETQTSSADIKRQLDVYGLWKFNPTMQLRVSANNLVNSNYLTASSIAGTNGVQTATVTTQIYTTWTIRLEMKI